MKWYQNYLNLPFHFPYLKSVGQNWLQTASMALATFSKELQSILSSSLSQAPVWIPWRQQINVCLFCICFFVRICLYLEAGDFWALGEWDCGVANVAAISDPGLPDDILRAPHGLAVDGEGNHSLGGCGWWLGCWVRVVAAVISWIKVGALAVVHPTFEATGAVAVTVTVTFADLNIMLNIFVLQLFQGFKVTQFTLHSTQLKLTCHWVKNNKIWPCNPFSSRSKSLHHRNHFLRWPAWPTQRDLGNYK